MAAKKGVVSRFGQMAHAMKVTGKTIKRTEKVLSSMLMETSTVVSGSTTKLMAMASTSTPTEQCTWESGSKINNTDRVLRHGPMAHATKASTWMERRMGKAPSHLRMEVFTRDSSTKMKYQEKASTTGLTKRPTVVLGSRTKCTVKALSSGLTANSMKELSKTISAKAMASSPGRTAGSTMESGKMENRMEKASSSIRKTSRGEASGRAARTLNG